MGVISGHRFLGKPPRAPQQWPRPLPTAFLRQTGGDTHRAALHVACALSFVWFPPRRCPPGLGRIESAHFSFHYFLLHLTVEDFLLWELSVAQLWFGEMPLGKRFGATQLPHTILEVHDFSLLIGN